MSDSDTKALPEWKPGQVYRDNKSVYIIMNTTEGLRPFWICGAWDGSENFKQTRNPASVFKGDTFIMTLDAKYMKQQILKSVGIEWEPDYVPKD